MGHDGFDPAVALGGFDPTAGAAHLRAQALLFYVKAIWLPSLQQIHGRCLPAPAAGLAPAFPFSPTHTAPQHNTTNSPTTTHAGMSIPSRRCRSQKRRNYRQPRSRRLVLRMHTHSDAKKFGLNRPRPSPGYPTSVTSCSTPAAIPHPPVGSVFDDRYGQDGVFGLNGLGGFYGECESGCFDYGDSPPPPPGRDSWVCSRSCCV
jgi:hypothetical protein